jgi:hypothetical protein
MKELEACDADDPRFTPLVSELRKKLHHHATDEENEQFPQLRARLPHDKLVKMREQVQTAPLLSSDCCSATTRTSSRKEPGSSTGRETAGPCPGESVPTTLHPSRVSAPQVVPSFGAHH